MINYNIASKTYDHTRKPSDEIIARFASRVSFTATTAILDFGCGTGNYLNALQLAFRTRCCGVEPSEGMRAFAAEKKSSLDIWFRKLARHDGFTEPRHGASVASDRVR